MRLSRHLVVAALAVLALALPAPSPARAAPAQTERYILGSYPHPFPQCYLNGSRMRPSWGGACFLPPAGVARVSVTIDDDSGFPVPGRLLFTVDEAEVEGPAFCASIAGVPVPARAEGINVSMSPVRTGTACGALARRASSGSITVTY